MANIILYIATSLDMFIASEDGSVDWLFSEGEYGYDAFLAGIGTTLMGKKTYDQVLSFGEWPYKGKTNYVFSRDVKLQDTEDVSFVSGDIPSFLKRLKKETDKDIWLIGGGEIIRICMQAGLVDELMLFVHPIVLGKGIPLFIPQELRQDYTLKKVNPFPNDLLELHYLKK